MSHFLSDKQGYEDLTAKPCTIKNDVWIGTQAVIRRGVTIGNGAIIGANSFVNKDVPDYSVWGGVPAKLLKYRFDEQTRNDLLASRYWEYPPEEAKKIIASIKKPA
jgi:acetyltransferase-like isoleucine patch superfamily enzyme